MNDPWPEVAEVAQRATESGNDEQPPALARPEAFGPALARPEATGVTGPLRYGVQFSASEELLQFGLRSGSPKM